MYSQMILLWLVYMLASRLQGPAFNIFTVCFKDRNNKYLNGHISAGKKNNTDNSLQLSLEDGWFILNSFVLISYVN